MSNSQPKKLLFSLEGVDRNDDVAIEAFAQHVWEQATAAFGERPNNHCETEENDDDRGIHNDE